MIRSMLKWSAPVLGLLAVVAAAHARPNPNDPRDPGSSPRPPQALTNFGEAQPIPEPLRVDDGMTACRAWWDNGSYDGRNGLNSQVLFANEHQVMFEALVADDFLLKFGQCYWIESIEVCMAVFGVDEPVVELRVWDDCNGEPSTPAFDTFVDPWVINEGEVPGWPGFTKYRFVFKTELFEYGYRRLWISPVGQGQGLYYWLTANQGVIQGVQGKYRSAQNGVPKWTDVDALGQNFGICSDFNFRVCGKCCWLLKDNSDFDTVGLPQSALTMGTIFGVRVVDNFQVPPGKDIEVCRIEAWMATNCDPKRAFMEIYNNSCDTPIGNPIVLAHPDYERLWIADSPMTIQGMPVYRFSFTCPPVILQGGYDYWLSMAALGLGTPHEKAIWLYKRKNGCSTINITEGQFKSPFFTMFRSFTPVSHPGLAGEPRDFAFRFYGAELDVPMPIRFPNEPVDLRELILGSTNGGARTGELLHGVQHEK